MQTCFLNIVIGLQCIKSYSETALTAKHLVHPEVLAIQPSTNLFSLWCLLVDAFCVQSFSNEQLGAGRTAPHKQVPFTGFFKSH